MAVVRVRGPLKQRAGGRAEHVVDGVSVADLVRGLERAHPELCGWILDERGSVRRHINVFVNGELGTGATPVSEDDRIEVVPAISGGSE